MNINSYCRLCAEKAPDLLSLSDPVSVNLNLLHKIAHCFHLEIQENDKLSKNICSKCFSQVFIAYNFYETIQNNQELLRSILLQIETFNWPEPEITLDSDDSKDIKPELLLGSDFLKDDFIDFESKDESSQIEEQLSVQSDVKPEPKPAEPDPITQDNNNWKCYLWKCSLCSLNFPTVSILQNHFKTSHNQDVNYTCLDCTKPFENYNEFISHVKDHRPHLKLDCDFCSKSFPTVEKLETHRSKHPEFHRCPQCYKTFQTHSAMLKHQRFHLPETEKNTYSCDLCSKKFGTKPNLLQHKRIHAGIKNFICPKCGKSFIQKGNLESHLLTHTMSRPYQCSKCPKSFKSVGRLKKHEIVHSDLKPFECDTCGKQFREKGTLTDHRRIHTGAMPFVCEYCGKKFRFKGILTCHRRQHTGERPYSCNECQHHFTNWPNYNKHMKRRHGINTSVTVRKPQEIPPTGKPCRNPPGSVIVQPPLVPPDLVVINQGEVEPQAFINSIGVNVTPILNNPVSTQPNIIIEPAPTTTYHLMPNILGLYNVQTLNSTQLLQ